MAMRINPELKGKSITDVQPKPGDWDNMLLQIRPIARDSVMWPPESDLHQQRPPLDRYTYGPLANRKGCLSL